MIASLDLLATDRGGLRSTVREGSRSLLFEFSRPDDDEDAEVRFGAVIDRIRAGSGEPGLEMEVELWFWIELASIYAAPGAEFGLWYAGRSVGRGHVLTVCNDHRDRAS